MDINHSPDSTNRQCVAAAAALQAGPLRTRSNNIEAAIFAAYFFIYLFYLFRYQEDELTHWLSLVILPSALLLIIQSRSGVSSRLFRYMLNSVGISKYSWKNGILLAIVAGIGLSTLCLFGTETRLEVWDKIVSGKIAVAYPLAFVAMLLTAGFTEEFFFRGVLQTRMVKMLGSRLWGIAIASTLFGLYHLPYAYLNPDWPSHGDWGAALVSALGQGIPAGIALGFLYEWSKNNLLACVIMHSVINALPAVAMLKM